MLALPFLKIFCLTIRLRIFVLIVELSCYAPVPAPKAIDSVLYRWMLDAVASCAANDQHPRWPAVLDELKIRNARASLASDYVEYIKDYVSIIRVVHFARKFLTFFRLGMEK
jgi:hypothetical protein